MVRVFQNLIGNAIQYRSDEPARIHITAELLGHEWLVKSKDNGIGIAPQYHECIFGRFKRLHGRDIPGTGIGLAICKKIVEGLGGRIWVESESGKGSTFCFTICGSRAEGLLSSERASAEWQNFPPGRFRCKPQWRETCLIGIGLEAN
jgi:light-regulated signal transduction histidine kinase (bacteriophytochrome)